MSEFVECPECATRPGTPALCPACLANRSTIERLRGANLDAEEIKIRLRLQIAELEAKEAPKATPLPPRSTDFWRSYNAQIDQLLELARGRAMMAGHFIVRCHGCDSVVSQCRCPGPKTESWVESCCNCPTDEPEAQLTPTSPPGATVAAQALTTCNNCAYYSWKTDPDDGAGKCFRDSRKDGEAKRTWWTEANMVCDSWKQDPHPPEKETPAPPRRPATRDEILHVKNRTKARFLPDGTTEYQCRHEKWFGECAVCNEEIIEMKQPKGTNKAIRKAAGKLLRYSGRPSREADPGHYASTREHFYLTPKKYIDRLRAELKAREERPKPSKIQT